GQLGNQFNLAVQARRQPGSTFKVFVLTAAVARGVNPSSTYYPGGEIPMTSVHGISVAGGTFPAEIWRRFMESALGSLRPQDWSEPRHLPTWKPFQRGKYSLSYVPSYLLPPTTDTSSPTAGP